jgi:putative SOS response-associated peptidase YedK
MCGRFNLNIDSGFASHFNLSSEEVLLLDKSYQATPGKILPIIINGVFFKKWGLESSNLIFNVRAETIADKFNKIIANRCLIPASGFYENKNYFTLTQQPLFAFAGLYNQNYFTLITTTPNSLISPIHHRMPVILSPSDYSTWLTADIPSALNLLSPYSSAHMSLSAPVLPLFAKS